MNEQLGRADEYANFVEAFIHNHPLVTAILVAILCSWSATIIFKLVLVRPLVPPRFHVSLIFLFDVLVAGFIVVKMWPGDHKFIWALLVGTSSPTAYAIAAGVLCWWRPGLRKFLQLREFTPAPDPTDEAAATADPPPDHSDTH